MRINHDFSDLSCLERLREDDIRAFDQVFDLYAPELCRFAHGYLKSHADAEDAVQECFLKLWERRHTFDEGIIFKAYLYKSVYHAVLKHLRRQKYWAFEECGEETLIEEAGPGTVVEYQELEEFYQAAMAQLPRDIRPQPAGGPVLRQHRGRAEHLGEVRGKPDDTRAEIPEAVLPGARHVAGAGPASGSSARIKVTQSQLTTRKAASKRRRLVG